MTIQDILLIGDPRLYEISEPVKKEEVKELEPIVAQLGQVIKEFRATYGAGRAIAAPQLGIMKRLIVLNIDEPVAIINPVIRDYSKEQFEMWDDCMSFPNLLVKVRRHQCCTMTFKDLSWEDQVWELEGDLSELMQHEYDHLNGILATMRAVDDQSLRWRT